MSDATATLRIKAVMENSDVISNINQIQNRLESLKMPKDLTDRTKSKFEELTGLVKEYQNLMDKPHKSNADLRRLDQLNVQIKKIEKEAEKMIRSFDFSKIDTSEIDSAAIQKLNHELDETHKKIAQITKSSFNVKPDKGVDSLLSKIKEAQKAAEGTGSRKTKNLFQQLTEGINTGNLDQITRAIKELDRYLKPGAFNDVDKVIKPFTGVSDDVHRIVNELQKADSEFMQTAHSAEQLEDAIKAEIANRLTEMAKEANQVGDGFRDASNAAEAYRNSVTHAAKQQSEMQMQVQNLQQQIKNYFGLDEIFRKIGDLARSAMDTVKELDAAMTETAVVTNFDVSDMWKMLPTYTKNANQLGSTIADVYNAATLYYQQGLTTTQSMDLANETLKMARIGGIEAAEATDMMTAALRGFNMEINQTSAQRINDVYSKLAAITAADTKEIGTAMERTASISKSANMDFETTSAFLAQMIETTREAPENLGTAMKTIVARFQEMKVDPNTLVDSEGQRLDFNRVDKALKSVGISLVDEQNQFRNLDDVFLEISSRWDGMTQAQQRYIATIAAGSRQQSRFIAMMQDYGRTMELVDAAYTAEGAGQAQFEKTLESMDSKLNRLKNAWDQFAMGFMNADFLKVGVDTGTKFLDIFEKIITGFSKFASFGIDPFGSLIKSAITATAVFGGLLAMSKLLMAGVGKFAGMALGEEAKNMQGWTGAAVRNNSTKSLETKKKVEQAKQEGKAAGLAYEQAFSEARARGVGYKESAQKGMAAKAQYTNFFKQTRQVEQAIAKSGYSQAGQQAAQEFLQGLKTKLTSGKINLKQANEELAKQMKTGFEGANGKLKPVEIGIAPKFAGDGKNIIQTFNSIGASATSAGIGIQSFAMTLYGTPLQPFGMALGLVGQGLQGVGQLASGVSKALKTVQAAVIATTMAQEGLNAINLQGNAITVGSLVAEVSRATGLTTTAAAEQLLNAELAEENAELLVNIGLTDKDTASKVLNALASKKQADAAGKSTMSLKNLASTGLSKVIQIATKHPILTTVAASLLAVGAAGIIAYRAATKGERALKLQGDAAAQASQDLDTTKQALEAVNNDLEELANNDSKLDGLIKGTTEWNNALAEANAHIIEMMQNYKSLNEMSENGQYKYIQTDDYGRMSITQAGQERIRKEYENAVNLATANNAVQGAIYNNLKDLESKEYKNNARAMQINPAGSDKYKQAKLQNENIEQMNEARLENAWKTGIHAAIADSGISDTKAIESILTDQRDKLVDAVSLGTKTENKKAYADLMGYEYIKKNTYKDAQGNELEIDYKIVKETLPELQALSDAQANAISVQDSLTAAQSSYSAALAKTENENLKNLEGQDTLISDILSSNAEANLDAVDAFVNSAGKEQTGLEIFADQYKDYSKENAKILSDLTGTEVTSSNYTKALQDLKSQLQQNADNMIQQQQDAINGVAGVLDAANWKKDGTGREAEQAADDQIKNVIDKMTSAQINSMSKTAEGMSDNISNVISESYAKTVADLVDSGASKETIDKFQDVFDGIDFSSGLATLESFNKALEIDNQRVKDFGKEWDSSGEKANATAKAMQEVFSSDDFAEVEESLTESAKEIGHIDASAILTAAESSSSLQRYLDATGASAEGVARAFELISDGSISITDLTPSVVAAANAMEQLSASAGRANKFIESLEVKNDTGKYSDAIDSQKEAIDEMITNGEYGNEGLEQILSQTFGGEAWAKRYAEGTDGIKKLYNEYNKAANASADDISNLYKKGDTVEQMIGRIQKAYGVTAEYADVMLQKATNVDLKLKQALESRDKNQMINAAMQTSGIVDQNGKLQQKGGITSAGEIYTQALLYGGEDVSKQQEYLRKYAEKLGLNVDKISDTLDFANGDLEDWTTNLAKASTHVANFNSEMSGKEVEQELTKEWKSQGNTSETWWSKGSRIEGQKNTYDIQGIINQALANGANNTQAMEAAYEVVKRRVGDEGKTFKVGSTEFTADDLVNWETFSQKYNEAIENAQWTEIGTTIGEQIVAQMQAAHFDNLMGESGVTEANPYTNSGLQNGILETKIDAVWKEAQNNTSNRALQVDAIGKYLEKFAPEFEKLDPSKQAEALDGLVAKMNDWKFSPEEIVSAINQGFNTNLTTDNVTGNKPGEYGLEINKENLEGQLKGLEAEVTANITNITVSAKASGQNNHRFGTFARGSKGGYRIPGRPTLTGEEGEELVWEPKRNQAYMVGSNGPQFANISRDAVVWNAEQTKKIKKNSKTTGALGTGARGITPVGTMKGGNAGGGKGGGMTISGTFDIDAMANVKDVVPPAEKPEIPVKGKLEIENQKGGPLSKLLGKKESASIKVTAEATKVNVGERVKAIKVTGDVTKLNNKAGNVKGIKGTAKVTKVTKSGKVTGEPIKVKASAVLTGKAKGTAKTETIKTKADNTAQKDINSIKHKGAVVVKTKADNAAQRAINAIKGTTVSVHIKPIFEGNWTKNATVHVNTGAKGQNNYIAHRTAPSFGSAASGHYGRLGPKGRGGLTLTGEKGFEIAWLPSENRSMILGAKGPQMLTLPKDAVIWTHEQSKKILKQKQTIEAGSHAKTGRQRHSSNGNNNNNNSNNNNNNRHHNNNNSNNSSNGTSGRKKIIKNAKALLKKYSKVAQVAGKVNYWWWNMGKKVEQTQRKIDKLFKDIEKKLKNPLTKLNSLTKQGGQYIRKLNQQISLNKKMEKVANKNLSVLDRGNSTVQKRVKNRQAQVNKDKTALKNAKKELTKAKSEKAKKKAQKKVKKAEKKLKKDQKKLDKAKTGVNYATISYDVKINKAQEKYEKALKKYQKAKKKKDRKKAKKELDKAGKELKKKKTTKKTKKTKVNLSPYIKYDSATGEYQIDYDKINKKFGKNKSKAKAVGEAAQKKLDDYISKRNAAEDKIDAAKEKIEEYGQKIYETFYGWENELTKILNITKQIEAAEAQANKMKSASEASKAFLNASTEEAFLKFGDGLKYFKAEMTATATAIKKRGQAIEEQRTVVQKAIGTADENAELNVVNQRVAIENKTIKDTQAKIDKLKTERNKKKTSAKRKTAIDKEIAALQTKLNQAKEDKAVDTAYQTSLKQSIRVIEAARKYITTETLPDGSITVLLNSEALERDRLDPNKTISHELYEGIKKYYDDLLEQNEALNKLYEEQIDALAGLAETLQDLREQYADRSEELVEAIEDEAEAEIDKFEKLSSAITDSLKDLLDEVKNKLEERRRQEDNKKTRDDISKKQQRLAALRANTAGGNQVEIAQLEKEIADAQQDYQRTLEDQLLDRLQNQADEAAKQRERQIELMRMQLDVDKANGKNIALVNLYLSDVKGYSKEIEKLWKQKNDFDNQTDARKRDLEGKFATFMEDISTNGLVAKIAETEATIKKVEEDKQQTEQAINETANTISEGGGTATYEKTYEGAKKAKANNVSAAALKESGFSADLLIGEDKNNPVYSYTDLRLANYTPEEIKNTAGIDAAKQAYLQRLTDAEANKQMGVDEFLSVKNYANVAGLSAGSYLKDLAATEGLTWEIVLKTLVSAASKGKFGSYQNNMTGLAKKLVKTYAIAKPLSAKSLEIFSKAFNKAFSGYKFPNSGKQVTYDYTLSLVKKKDDKTTPFAFASGGLANYTGPAWLDGTPSKPELVLNPTDTKNFLALRDVLGKAVKTSNTTNNAYGNNTYEININVDHINNDYDVDRIAERVKKDIVKSASYRNVTQVRNFR